MLPVGTHAPLETFAVVRLLGSQVTCVTPFPSTQVRKASATAIAVSSPPSKLSAAAANGAVIATVLGSPHPAASSGASGMLISIGMAILPPTGISTGAGGLGPQA